jgi:hypothetical protein
MPVMSRSSWSSRVALWAAVCALLLKGAVPMFAAAAAGIRGVPVAEVCTVYGVALPKTPHGGHEHHHAQQGQEHPGHGEHGSHSPAEHTGDHCALTALAALAVPDAPALGVPSPHIAVSDAASARSINVRDASAAWAARLKHGPPRSPDAPTSLAS